jgi:hypothetical protein
LRTRPKYRFCWWCSKQLWGNSHQVMRSRDSVNGVREEVSVHRCCAESMQREGGWEEASALDLNGSNDPLSGGPQP